MASTDPFSALLERETFRHHVDGNSAKLAIYSEEILSSGWGESDVADCIVFDSLFIERPTVSHGFSVDGDTLIDGYYPRASGFVREWKLDPKGFYRGAWVSVTIDGGPLGVTGAGYNLIHSFVFTGTAIKPIREDLTAASDPLPNNELEVTSGN